jgi:hypothetical protein
MYYGLEYFKLVKTKEKRISVPNYFFQTKKLVLLSKIVLQFFWRICFGAKLQRPPNLDTFNVFSFGDNIRFFTVSFLLTYGVTQNGGYIKIPSSP